MIYHYTDKDSAADILRDGVLHARPVIVRTALIGGTAVELAPAVWFTVAETLPPTVAAKLTIVGRPLDRDVWRFVVADEAGVDLPDWAYPLGYPSEAFRWMLATAHLAGESWEGWRLIGADVPRAAWVAVEELRGGKWDTVHEPCPA